MQIDIIAVIPELLDSPFNHSIVKRAREKGLLTINVLDLKDFGLGKYRQVDDYQYGGGAGMVLKVEPLSNAIESLLVNNNYDEIIYLTPDGEQFDQATANELSLDKKLLLICGHYKGIDERIREQYITRELSIGDYVVSGGETAAIVIVDALGRLIPGAINDACSALNDSFQNDLLAPPVYTRPAEYNGRKVPDILLSGHQAKIEEWRDNMALKRTKERRPDLLENDK